MRRYRKVEIIEQRLPGDTDDDLQRRIERLDRFDARQEPYVALNESKWWWILELLPVPKIAQREPDRSSPKTERSPNAGAPRTVNCQKLTYPIRLHCSVFTHINDNPEYKPAAEWFSWPDDEWPEVEEGTMSSIMADGDDESEAVRKRLRMSWREPTVENLFTKLARVPTKVWVVIFTSVLPTVGVVLVTVTKGPLAMGELQVNPSGQQVLGRSEG
ncbi:hypothetical protein FRC11_011520 [Ceratobasidium sp. 423]|nr:hypothetical protein FRC11_011520 [Ceratobasidium sp. 423]